jgi:hypothetical protein
MDVSRTLGVELPGPPQPIKMNPNTSNTTTAKLLHK